MLIITDSARKQFKQIMQQNPDKCLRVIFEGFGWGGPRLGLALDELKEENKTVTVNDVEILIAENVLPYTRGSVIDYLDSERGQGFTISAVAGSCWFT